jgi:hypothetical protein
VPTAGVAVLAAGHFGAKVLTLAPVPWLRLFIPVAKVANITLFGIILGFSHP